MLPSRLGSWRGFSVVGQHELTASGWSSESWWCSDLEESLVICKAELMVGGLGISSQLSMLVENVPGG